MSLDLEQRFICALLRASRTDQLAFIHRHLPTKIFRSREHEITWILRQYSKHGKMPSPATFRARFEWNPVRVSETLNEAIESVMGMEHYRCIRQTVDKVRDKIAAGVPYPEIIDSYKSDVNGLTDYAYSLDDIDVSKSVGALHRYYENVRSRGDERGRYDSPWPTLNKTFGNIRPQDYAVLMGRLGMGKTYFMLEWALHLAAKNVRTLFVSKEMGTERIEERIEMMRFQLNPIRYKEGTMDLKELIEWRTKRANSALKDFPLLISGKESIDGTGFSDISQAINQYRPEAVFVDAAYRIVIEQEKKYKFTDTEKFRKIAETSKRMAKYHNVAMFQSIQMNRGAENKEETNGGVVNAYGSDAWAQEADLLLGIQGARESNLRTLEVLKSRESGMGEVMINFSFNPYINLKELNSVSHSTNVPKTKVSPIIKFKAAK